MYILIADWERQIFPEAAVIEPILTTVVKVRSH
jgi:hypothetical protein